MDKQTHINTIQQINTETNNQRTLSTTLRMRYGSNANAVNDLLAIVRGQHIDTVQRRRAVELVVKRLRTALKDMAVDIKGDKQTHLYSIIPLIKKEKQAPPVLNVIAPAIVETVTEQAATIDSVLAAFNALSDDDRFAFLQKIGASMLVPKTKKIKMAA